MGVGVSSAMAERWSMAIHIRYVKPVANALLHSGWIQLWCGKIIGESLNEQKTHPSFLYRWGSPAVPFTWQARKVGDNPHQAHGHPKGFVPCLFAWCCSSRAPDRWKPRYCLWLHFKIIIFFNFLLNPAIFPPPFRRDIAGAQMKKNARYDFKPIPIVRNKNIILCNAFILKIELGSWLKETNQLF